MTHAPRRPTPRSPARSSATGSCVDADRPGARSPRDARRDGDPRQAQASLHAAHSTSVTSSSSINAEKVKLTGNKLDKKQFRRHTGYPGGLVEIPYRRAPRDASRTRDRAAPSRGCSRRAGSAVSCVTSSRSTRARSTRTSRRSPKPLDVDGPIPCPRRAPPAAKPRKPPKEKKAKTALEGADEEVLAGQEEADRPQEADGAEEHAARREGRRDR